METIKITSQKEFDNLPKSFDKFTCSEAINITSGAYGSQEFKKFFIRGEK